MLLYAAGKGGGAVKIKQLLMAAIAVLLIFSAPPSHALSAEQSTEIECFVEPVYEFSVPKRAVMRYPETHMDAGSLTVVDLFLDYGEWLSVEIYPGELNANDTSVPELPYTVEADVPDEITAEHIGEGYGISVYIQADDFEQAEAKKYDADISFRAVSSLSGAVVWEETMRLTVHKTKKVKDETKDTESLGEEDVPASPAPDEGFPWWLIYTAAGAAVSAAIIILLLKKETQYEQVKLPY